MKNLIVVIGLFIIFSISTAFGVDLGKRATSFEIKEEGFVAMMKRKIAKIDMEAEREKMGKIAEERVNNPTPVAGMSRATKTQSFYYDPTYTLDKDAVLQCGKILHKAGTKVNPLEHMDLNRRLFFIDSRDKHQVEWLEEQLNNPAPDQKQVPVEDRVILVGGSVFKLKEILPEHADKVYFDQHGELTSKFKIKHSPAIAEQDGLKIRIDEINLLN